MSLEDILETDNNSNGGTMRYMTKKESNESIRQFKILCKEKGYRRELQKDKLPIAVSRRRKLVRAHFYEGFLNGDLGIWIETNTPRMLDNKIKQLEALGATLKQRASLPEATMRFGVDKLDSIASFLGISSNSRGHV